MTNSEDGFPVTSNVYNIDQVERIQQWLTDRAIDHVGYIAGILDRIQQGLTLASGGTLQNVSALIKKELQRNGRVITKLQSSIDAANKEYTIEVNAKNEELNNTLNELPTPIESINTGIIPVTPTAVTVDVSPSVTLAPNPIVPCSEGPIRTNPDTCEIEQCTPNGSYIGTGKYNQSCLDAKNPPPQQPPGGGYGSCGPLAGKIDYNVNAILSGCSYSLPVYTQEIPTKEMWDFMRGWIATNKSFVIVNNTHSAKGPFSEDVIEVGDPDGKGYMLPCVVNIPIKRTISYNYSPFSEDGSWLMSNKWQGQSFYDHFDSSTTANDYASRAFDMSPYSPLVLDILVLGDIKPPENV